MSQKKTLSDLIEQVQEAKDEEIKALSEELSIQSEGFGVFFADMSATLNEIKELVDIILPDISNSLNIISEKIVGGVEKIIDPSAGIEAEEAVREDQSFKSKMLGLVGDLAEKSDEVTDPDKEGGSKGFFGKLSTIAIGFFQLLMAPILIVVKDFKLVYGAITKGMSKLFGSTGILSKVFGKGGYIASWFGKGSLFAKIFGSGGLVAKMFNGIKRLFGPIGQLLSKVGGWLKVAGKLFAPLGAIITAFVAIKAALDEFLAGGDPADIFAAAFSAIVEFFSFGFLKAEDITEPITNGIGHIFGFIKSAIDFVMDFIDTQIMPFIQNTLIPTFMSIWDELKKFFDTVFMPLIIDGFIPILKSIIFEVLIPIAKRIWNTLKIVFDIILIAFKAIWKIIAPIYAAIANFIVKVLVPLVVKFIIPAAMIIINIVWTIVDAILKVVRWLLGWLVDSGVLDFIVSIITGVINIITWVFTFIGKMIMGLWEGIKVVGSVVMTIVGGIMEVFSSIGSFFKKIPAAFAAGIKAMVPGGKSPVEAFMEVMSKDTGTKSAGRVKGRKKTTEEKKDDSLAVASGLEGLGEMELPTVPAMPLNDSQQKMDIQAASGGITNIINAPNNSQTTIGGGGGGGPVVAPQSSRNNESTFSRMANVFYGQPY